MKSLHTLFLAILVTACGTGTVQLTEMSTDSVLETSANAGDAILPGGPAGPGSTTPGSGTPTGTPSPSGSPSPSSAPSPTPTPSGPRPPAPSVQFVPPADEPCDIFVNKNHPSCTADDSPRNLNNLGNPYCNIKGATDHDIPGDVVCIYPGEYREPIVPESGVSNTNRTVFKGVGNRSEIVVLGSQEVTGWARCGVDVSCPSPGAGVDVTRIYRAPFQADTQCREGTPRVIIRNTNCIIDRQRGLIRATDDPFYDDYDTFQDLNANEEFFYQDSTPGYLYVYMNSDPSGHQIECTKGRNIVASEGVLRDFTIQNLTISQANYKGITFGGSINTRNILVYNNEVSFTHGEGYCSENPAAIFTATEGYAPLIQNIQIVGNLVHDIGSDRGPWNDTRIESTTHAGCAIETYSITNSLVEGNEVYNAFQSIGMKAGNAGYVVRNNVIHDADEGIWIGSTGPRDQTVPLFGADVIGNLIYDLSTARSSGLGIYNNYGQIYYNITGNTLFNTRGIHLITEPDPTRPVTDTFPTIRNNIVSTLLRTSEKFLTANWNVLPNLDSDYNLFFDTKSITNFATSDTNATASDGQTTYRFLSDWNTDTTNDRHSSYQDPRFLNLGARDFRLQASSPARNAGEKTAAHCARADDDPNPMDPSALCIHYCETLPDLGAFEYCPNAP